MRICFIVLLSFIGLTFSISPAISQQTTPPQTPLLVEDLSIQGEYVGSGKAMQVIARGDGDFEIVVYELGLPGDGWDKSPARRVDGDADTVDQLIESMELQRVERRSPTLGAQPPKDAIVLFDGSAESLNAHWGDGARRTDDGLLMEGATTKRTFSDYHLHLEFMTPFMPTASGQARGNSGVYHQGRYETQILDSFGTDGLKNETGAIYEVRAPDVNACFPPMSWQTYDIDFTAARYDDAGNKVSPAQLTVILNGVPVQVNVEVPAATRAAPKKETPDPGPLFLQDHGNPVRFRNIWITPRDLNKEARRPIVPGYERLFSQSDPKGLGGRMLIDALGCRSCHTLDPNTSPGVQGPNLKDVASRVRHDHLVKFIASPHAAKPGTAMPDLWHGWSDEKRMNAATAITSFLVHKKPKLVDEIGDPSAADRGKSLYHNQGCVACHAPMELNDKSPAPRASVPLGDLQAKYSLASLTSFLIDPLAVRPCGRMPKVVANAGEARDIATYLLRNVVLIDGGQTIRRKIYRGQWDRLPDLTKLEIDSESTVSELKIDDISGSFAASFDSFLQIRKTGKYTFRLASDDGSRLIINGETIIDHDGVHPETEKKKTIRLKAGVLPVQVLYFEGGGQRGLKLSIESDEAGTGSIKTMLVATAQGRQEELIPTKFIADQSLVQQGASLFKTSGCANCHNFEARESRSESLPTAEPLSECRPDTGCLAIDVPEGLPNFDLTSNQRQHINAALGVDAIDESDLVHFTMASMNCYSCHARGSIGGPDTARNEFFTTVTPEMGDEGRMPPNLAGVGDKLSQSYLQDIVRNGVDERPYMRTRMPGFGDSIPEAFVATIVKLDLRNEGHDGETVEASLDDQLTNGRTLCGNAGLACIKCHTFNGVGLPGIQAIDMLRMPVRLRRDWFERYLLAPQAYRPGTRMPASFIDGKSVLTGIADGRPVDQIDAMWRYLSQGKDAKVPSGLVPDAIELSDPNRPVIYRNFINGSSPRGIAVGYPESINILWDAETMKLASAWKNGFIDAAKHWTGRGAGNQDPLGDAVIQLDRQTPVASEIDANVSWAAQANDKTKPRFLGYRLDKAGRPTFRYQVSGLAVEDRVEPVDAGSTTLAFVRTLKINGSPMSNALFASGDIKLQDDGSYLVDNRYRVRILQGNAKLLTFDGQSELRASSSANTTQETILSAQVSW